MRVEHKSFYADLFTRKPEPEPGRALVAVGTPSAGTPSAGPPAPKLPAVVSTKAVQNALVEAPEAPKDAPADVRAAKEKSPVVEKTSAVDTHHLSPRQMVNFSLDLYAAGAISFDDYSLLAFQPELQRDFGRTIGALTGETAEPDRPRDFVRIWDDRTDFQRRHNNARKDLIEQSERIASVLRQIDQPMNVVV